MTNYSHGHEAEKHAATYLKKQGYKIIELNWRHVRAEIDIIAHRRHQPLTFFEVKYREDLRQGSGFDYITERKLLKMQFAAELWASEHNYSSEYQLGAIELSGPDFTVSGLVESVIS